MARGDTRCIEGRLWRHDPQPDDPYLETEIGQCPECQGADCEKLAALDNDNEGDDTATDCKELCAVA